MAGNSNAAYDFSRFETPEPKRQEQARKAPEVRVVAGRRSRPKGNPLPRFCLFVLMIAAIVLIIYSQVVLAELSTEISSAQARLTALESESTRLSAQLTGVSSSRALEETATARLGLSRMDSTQIVYIDMQEQDNTRITDKGMMKTGGEKISGTAGEIMEYLKLK